jgi:hypothetical protein
VEEEADKSRFDAIVEGADMLPHDCLDIHVMIAFVLVVSDLEFLRPPSIIVI